MRFEKMCIFSITTSLSKVSAIKYNPPFEPASSGCYMRRRSNQVSGLKYKPFCLGTPTFSVREGLFAQNLSEFQKGRTWIQHLPRIFSEKKIILANAVCTTFSLDHTRGSHVSLTITWAPFSFIHEHNRPTLDKGILALLTNQPSTFDLIRVATMWDWNRGQLTG